MEIIVANKRDGAAGEYIGRPSPLGNPFSHLKHGTLAQHRVNTREEAVADYHLWLRGKIAAKDRLVCDELNRLFKIARERGTLTLVCWCAPRACHGDVVRKILLEKLEG